jgi:hypothetical protein
MTGLVAGALAMAYLVAATFFLRFWRDSRERLFLLFAVAFGMLMVQRVMLTVVGDDPDASLALYGLRLLAFLLIVVAVLDKNRSAG